MPKTAVNKTVMYNLCPNRAYKGGNILKQLLHKLIG